MDDGPRDDDAIEALLASVTSAYGKQELAARFQAAGLEASPVLTPAELVADDQLDARGFFVDVTVDGSTVRLPGSPLRGLADPSGPAPRFGQHTSAVVGLLAD